MYIYGVLHLRSGVTSAGRYVSEEGVSRWGTGWLFLGWKFASHPKLMILKTRVCRRAITKVFQNFVGVWTTKSPQSRLVLIYALKSLSAGGWGWTGWDTCFTYSPVSLHETNTAPCRFPMERLVGYLTRTLGTVLSLRKCCPEKVPLPEACSCRESLTSQAKLHNLGLLGLNYSPSLGTEIQTVCNIRTI